MPYTTDLRPHELDPQATKSLSNIVVVDNSTFAEPLNQTLNVLRTDVSLTVDATSQATYTLDYTNYERLVVTIDQDCVLTPTNIPDGATVYLKLTKGAANEVSFSGVTGTVDGRIIGTGTIIYRIINKAGNIIVITENTQYGGSLESSDLTIDSGSIGTFYFFNWQINNNICTLEAKFSLVDYSGTTSEYNISLSNFTPELYNEEIALNVFETNTSFDYRALLTDNNIFLKLAPTPTVGNGATLRLNASFRIK